MALKAPPTDCSSSGSGRRSTGRGLLTLPSPGAGRGDDPAPPARAGHGTRVLEKAPGSVHSFPVEGRADPGLRLHLSCTVLKPTAFATQGRAHGARAHQWLF